MHGPLSDGRLVSKGVEGLRQVLGGGSLNDLGFPWGGLYTSEKNGLCIKGA